MKLSSILIALVMIPQLSIASGGWVGNSPVQIVRYKSDTYRQSVSADMPATEEWNSLLLPKGMSQLRFDWGMIQPKYYDSTYYLDFSYRYAFTEKLTTNTFVNWGYSLLSGNGKGHEVALYFGLYGLGYSTITGLMMAPGAGLGYAYTDGPWRFTTRFIVLNSYYFKDSEWGRAQVRSDSDINYQWNEKWTTGLAVKANVTEADSQLGEYTLRDSEVFLRPTATVTRTLKEFGADKQHMDITVGVGLDDVRNSNIGVVWTW